MLRRPYAYQRYRQHRLNDHPHSSTASTLAGIGGFVWYILWFAHGCSITLYFGYALDGLLGSFTSQLLAGQNILGPLIRLFDVRVNIH